MKSRELISKKSLLNPFTIDPNQSKKKKKWYKIEKNPQERLNFSLT